MEITDLLTKVTFLGVPILVWLVVGVAIQVCRVWYIEWRDERRWRKEDKAEIKELARKYRYEPHVIDGIDYGKWVRTDGSPVTPSEEVTLINRWGLGWELLKNPDMRNKIEEQAAKTAAQTE
jgi:hypothetical protein